MYTKDKAHRITLRVNEEQFNFVASQAADLGVSPSDFLRMVINSSLAQFKRMHDRADKALDGLEDDIKEVIKDVVDQEGKGRENDKADNNNKL